MLAKLSLADRRGRNGTSHEPLTYTPPEITEFVEKAKRAKVLAAKEEPILQGKDLMPYIQPGPPMGELLKRAYEIQIEQGIADKNELLKRILDTSQQQ